MPFIARWRLRVASMEKLSAFAIEIAVAQYFTAEFNDCVPPPPPSPSPPPPPLVPKYLMNLAVFLRKIR